MKKHQLTPAINFPGSLLSLLLILVMSAVVTGCSGKNGGQGEKERARSILAGNIKDAQKALPINVEFGRITKIDYDRDSNVVVMRLQILDGNLAEIYNGLPGQQMDYSKRFKIIMSISDMHDMVQCIADADASLNLVLVDAASRGLVDVTLDANDVKECAGGNLAWNDALKLLIIDEVESSKSLWPMDAGNGVTVLDMSYDEGGNKLCIKYKLTEGELDYSHTTPEMVKDAFKLYLVSKEASFYTKYLVMGNMGLSLEVVTDKGKNMAASYTPEEIRDVIENTNEKDLARIVIGNGVKAEKAKMPSTLQTGVVLKDGYLKGDDVVYVVSVDDGMYSMDLIGGEVDKFNIVNSLSSQPAVLQQILQAEVNIVYRYVGKNSGRVKELKITPSDIRSTMKIVSNIKPYNPGN